MSSNQTVLEALAQEGIRITEEELLQVMERGPCESTSRNGAVTYPHGLRERGPIPNRGITTPEKVESEGYVTPGELTPSDLIFLSLMPSFRKEVYGGFRVQLSSPPSCETIIEATLATALLANEESGAIRLEVVPTYKFFGLWSVTTLVAARTGNVAKWPAGSLEANIYRVIPRPPAAELSETIYRWLGEDSCKPWELAVESVKNKMVARGLIQKAVERVQRKFLIFTWVSTKTHYLLPERTQAVIERQPMESVERKLQTCQLMRPRLWNRLVNEIGKGVRRRTLAEGG